MTDLQLLFAILAALYLWECGCWVRRGTVAFRTWFGGKWKLRHPGIQLGNQNGGLVFAAPLPPLGMFLTASQLPFSAGPKGLLLFVATAANPAGRPQQNGTFYQWDQLREISVTGKKVRVNGKAVIKTSSEPFAHFLAAQMRELQKTTEKERAVRIQKLARSSLDTDAIEEQVKSFREKTSWISALANTLFVYIFCAVPLTIWRLGLAGTWPLLLGGLLLGTITLAILFRRLHRDYFPKAEDERFTHFLIIMLSPATTIRTLDLLSRPLLEHFHPLAVSKVLCSEEAFKNYARLTWREMRYPALPLGPAADALAQETEEFWRGTLTTEVERFLKRNGVKTDTLLSPPSQIEHGCVAYCPRCEAQYASLTQTCEDCGGRKLLPLPAAAQLQTK